MTTIRCAGDNSQQDGSSRKSKFSKARKLNFRAADIEQTYQEHVKQRLKEHQPESLRDIEETVRTPMGNDGNGGIETKEKIMQ
eukprot:6668519-Karenia_brevis.AAC.1